MIKKCYCKKKLDAGYYVGLKDSATLYLKTLQKKTFPTPLENYLVYWKMTLSIPSSCMFFVVVVFLLSLLPRKQGIGPYHDTQY